MQSTQPPPAPLYFLPIPVPNDLRGVPCLDSYASPVTVSYIVLDLSSLALWAYPKTAGGQPTLSDLGLQSYVRKPLP